jgi:hypothetical protein
MVLSDREVQEIEKARRGGVAGPALLAWIDRLLQDRRERVEQLRHVRQRLGQAFRYLDGLIASGAPGPQVPSGAVRPCPKCGANYEFARPHASSRGKIYVHRGGKECVEIPGGLA